MAHHKDITGERFGKLTAVKRVEDPKKNRNALWMFKCDCGNDKITYPYYLNKNKPSSCGCSLSDDRRKKATIHGISNTKIYQTWMCMNRRCYNESESNYPNYGARGIIVCEEWRNDVKSFYDWSISNGWEEGLTIDRIDTNGNYEPSNCKWSTAKEQAINRRTTRYIEYNGQKKTMDEWGKVYGISRWVIKNRLKNKWPLEQLFLPVCKDPHERFRKGIAVRKKRTSKNKSGSRYFIQTIGKQY